MGTTGDDRARVAELADLVVPRLIRFAVRSGLVDELERGPRSTSDLARLTGSDSIALGRALALLGALEIVDSEGGEWTLGVLGAFLATKHPDSLEPQFRQTSFNLLLDDCRDRVSESIASGGPVVPPNMTWSSVATNDASQSAFDEMMHSRSVAPARDLFKHLKLPHPHTVVDIACGPGTYLHEALTASPSCTAIGLDKSPNAGRILKSSRRLSGRYLIYEQDMFTDPIPPSKEAYLLCSVLHDWEDGFALRLMRRVSEVMTSNSMLVIVERLPTAARLAAGHARLDLDMLVAFGGRERTTTELVDLASAAGLSFDNHYDLTGQFGALIFKEGR